MGNEISQIPLRDRKGNVRAYALVDASDYELVADKRWHLNSGGYVVHTTPTGPSGKQDTIVMSRLLMGCKPGDGLKVDHFDHDLLNNTRTNLRICEHQQNHENRVSHKGSSSKYRGVSWSKDKQKWVANCMRNYKNVYLGAFEDEDEAARVVAEYRAKHMPYSLEAAA